MTLGNGLDQLDHHDQIVVVAARSMAQTASMLPAGHACELLADDRGAVLARLTNDRERQIANSERSVQ